MLDQLADAVWGDHPPTSWPTQVQICVGRLRKALGGGRPLGCGKSSLVHTELLPALARGGAVRPVGSELQLPLSVGTGRAGRTRRSS